jgi:hypothetical protein
MKKLSLEERWVSKIDESSDDDSCWLWIGSRSTQVYGQMCVNKKLVLAHQIGWQLSGRSLCRGKTHLRNKCGNKICVNPDHWEKELKVKSLLGCSGEDLD